MGNRETEMTDVQQIDLGPDTSAGAEEESAGTVACKADIAI